MKDNPPIICKKIYEENDLGKGIDILHKGKAFNILWNKIYKTEIIKKNNIRLDVQIWRGEDYKFNIDYFKYINKIMITNESLYNYCIGNSGLTSKYDYKEFERRISNLNHHRDLYLEKGFDLSYVNTLYIISAVAGVTKIDSKKENLSRQQLKKRIIEIVNNEDLDKSLKMKNDGNIIVKIFSRILKHKLINCMIFINKLKIK